MLTAKIRKYFTSMYNAFPLLNPTGINQNFLNQKTIYYRLCSLATIKKTSLSTYKKYIDKEFPYSENDSPIYSTTGRTDHFVKNAAALSSFLFAELPVRLGLAFISD